MIPDYGSLLSDYTSESFKSGERSAGKEMERVPRLGISIAITAYIDGEVSVDKGGRFWRLCVRLPFVPGQICFPTKQ